MREVKRTGGRAGMGQMGPIGPICPIGPIFLIPILYCATLSAQTTPTALQHQQREQERARAMATELVSSVLDIQLQQLAENHLEKLPIYDEIKSMRANLGKLVDREMQEVVALLAQGQRAKEEEREQLTLEARARIRTIVVSLMAERQKLSKRLHLARLAAQISQLIDFETRVLHRTQALPEESPSARERTTLATLEDQRDVTALHFQFVEVLTDVATWDGPVGAGASQGMRLLKTLKLEDELRRADQSLTEGQFEVATKAEGAAIRGWRALLTVIEETQGLIGGDRDAIAKMVANLIKQQEQLREQTRQANPQDQQRTELLAQQQHDIQQELGQLGEALREFANVEPLATQAKAAALEAESKLFEGNTLDALQNQGQVLGALAEIEKRLEEATQTTSDKTADQLAQQVKQLEQLDQALDQVRAKQAEATKQANQNAPAAKGLEDQVAQQLNQANQAADFGSAIENRLADAQDLVARSQQALKNAAPQLAKQRMDAAQGATQAIDRAAAEVKQGLADARRGHLAVKVGELARAAEALERAAAAEREVGAAALTAAKTDGLSAAEAQDLAAEQARVQEVAKDIGEGVQHTAPQAAQQLVSVQPILATVAQQLQAAQKTPGEAAKSAANQAAEAAQQAAPQLEQAAKQLRQQAGQAATELAKLAEQSLQPTVAARQAVEQALTASANPTTSTTPLQQALDKTRAAQWEQLRATGQQAAADAQQQMHQIQAALRQQKVAAQAADEFVRGQSNTPLQAANAESQVSDFVKDLLKQASAPVKQELQTAADAAEEAAKELVVGNPNAANAARQTAQDSLQRALQAAEKEVADAAKSPAKSPDATAQARVSQLADEARRATGELAPEARDSLSLAKEQSDVAKKALAAQEAPVAANAQQKTTAALVKSAEQLQQAMQAADQKQTQQAAETAKLAEQLASQALPVDAGAAAALDQAAIAARQAAAENAPAEMPRDSQPEVTRGLERATASLAAREQDLRRDQEIATAIARLAQDQQAARDQIAQQSAKLEHMADAPSPGQTPPAPTPEEIAAAQKLAEAANQFAEAQRATGEGAAEISGQDEVVNLPIRQGLETASKLGQMSTPPATDQANPPSPNGKPAEAAQPKGQPGSEPKPKPLTDDPSLDDSPTNNNPPPQDLGTNFVPRSPEETARRIAGKEALEEAAKALAQQPPMAADPLSGDAAKKAQPQSAENSPQPADSQPTTAQKTQAAKKGEAALAADQKGKNEKLDPSQFEQETAAKERDSRAGNSQQSEDVAGRKFQQEPWFAKLPPALQNAIQAKSRRSAPRGYEERLKRYFESVE